MVPTKLTNKARQRAAESAEGRGSAKRNPNPQNTLRTQGRASVTRARARVREAARREKGRKLTALFHHIANDDALRDAYFSLKKTAAAGVDGMRWEQYGEELEKNIQDLSARLKRGAYRAKPVRRTYIPKADGKQRPLGVTALEDKVVQLAAVRVLTEVYEEEFRGFSYGFRPGRGQHQALDAVAVGIERRKVKWMLDADLRAFFDTIDHEWLVKFIEHRIADRRVVRLIRKWLNAGVLEDEELRRGEVGTPQGGNISPLLANIYLHYVLDTWADRWRETIARGDVILVRFADDFVMGFQHKSDAERFLGELRERLAKYKLELHPDKTRLFEFGRYAAADREARGEGKPETFDFLGLKHICDTTKRGWFKLRRETSPKKMRAKLQEVKTKLTARMHDPLPEVGEWLGKVVKGHFEYYGVPGNRGALWSFRGEVTKYWRHTLRRRSQHRIGWERMATLAKRWLPPVATSHPYPDQRLRVTTRGKSPVR
jgi:group II intron reverse transcriptase/maturase